MFVLGSWVFAYVIFVYVLGARNTGSPRAGVRASEVRVTYGDAAADTDTFEHVLSVTAHNDALLAYYYLDADNKMKMTEIYDVTEADTEAVQSPAERDANRQLEFDADVDWRAQLVADHDELDLDALDDELERTMFSEPESEWTPGARLSGSDGSDGDDQPESDQRH